MLKKAMMLIVLIAFVQGCGSFTKIRTTPFQGSPGYAVSGKTKRLDRDRGTFTVQLNVQKIWYEGDVDVYRERGMMLGSFRVQTREFPKIDRKATSQSLFDMEDNLEIQVFQKSKNSRAIAVPFKRYVISDDMIKFKVDRAAFMSSVQDLFVHISLDKKNTATTLKKGGRSWGKIKNSTVRLQSEVELCLTCSANKGV